MSENKKYGEIAKKAQQKHADYFFGELMKEEATAEGLGGEWENISLAIRRLESGEVTSSYETEGLIAKVKKIRGY